MIILGYEKFSYKIKISMNINLNPSKMNFKVRRQQFTVSNLLLLIILGGIFTGVGVFAIRLNDVNDNWVKITGKVIDASTHTSDGSTTYSPVVQYEVNSQSYEVASNFSTSSYPTIGESREVAYNPGRPDQSKIIENFGSTWWLYLFPTIGIVCLITAPLAFIRSRKHEKKIKQLLQSGQKLQGILVDVQTIGGNNSGYKIVVSATNIRGEVQNYVSDLLTGVGGLMMVDFRNAPIPIDVYVDPTNHQNYYVDVADIPNLTPERIGELVKSATQNQQGTAFADVEGNSVAPVNYPPSPPRN